MKLFRISYHDSKGRFIRRTYTDFTRAMAFLLGLDSDPLTAYNERPRFKEFRATHKG